MNRALSYRSFLLCLIAASLAWPGLIQAQSHGAPLQIVATFSIIGDIAEHVGGDHIDLHVLVGPNSDGHLYQPSPADARLLRNASLVIANGLGFEGWMDRLIQASGYAGAVVIATAGITPLLTGSGHELEPDPHAWQDIANIRVYIRNIEAALSRLAPENSSHFAANASALLHDIELLEQEIIATLQSIPAAARTIVTSHDAFAYFGKAYGLAFIAPVGISTDSEASARDVAALIGQIRREKIGAVFVENVTDQRLLDQIARETGATIGGTLYSDALSEPAGPAANYVQMMRHNLLTLTAALR